MKASNAQKITKQLKNNGNRITLKRTAIISILLDAKQPLSVFDVLARLKQKRLEVNKTTVYRELAFLQTQDIAAELRFEDQKRRYEIQRDHHHHAVCLKCKKIKEIRLNTHLEEEEKLIKKRQQFQVTKHSLEFFGLCGKCRK